MKTLFLLRHAKSDWSDEDLADFERPLNKRGRKSAPLVGSMMVSKGLQPDVIISSPAVRARQTAEFVHNIAAPTSPLILYPGIYEASSSILVGIIAEIDDKNGSAMIVGHNPGMEGLLTFLTRRTEPMPTAALAVIDLKTNSWSEILGGKGHLVSLFRPKESLAGGQPS